jgi:hypothetical protein
MASIKSFRLNQNVLTITVEKMPPAGKTPNNVNVYISSANTVYWPTSVQCGGDALDSPDSTVVLNAPPEAGRLTVQILQPKTLIVSSNRDDRYVPPPRAPQPPKDIRPGNATAKMGNQVTLTGQNMDSIDQWFLNDTPLAPVGAAPTASSFIVPGTALAAAEASKDYFIYYSATPAGVKKTSTNFRIKVTR